jgi:hypothetical protein
LQLKAIRAAVLGKRPAYYSGLPNRYHSVISGRIPVVPDV